MNIDYIFYNLKEILNIRNWKAKSVVVLLFLSLLFQTPRYGFLYNYLSDKEVSSKYEAILLQKEEPFVHHDYGVGRHEGSMEFRLFVPLFMKLFSLNIFSVYVFQVLLGLFLLYKVLDYIQAQTGNRLIAFLFTTSFVFVYSGSAFLIDVYGFYDSIAYSLIFFAFMSTRPFVVFILVFLSLYVDERSYIACVGIVLYQIFNNKDKRIVFSVAFAIILGLLCRFYLHQYHGLFLHSNQLLAKDTFMRNINNIGLATISVFKGFGLMFIVSVFILLVQKKYKYAFLGFIYFSSLYFSSFIVYDLTRSFSYLILMLPISHSICNNYLSEKKMLFLYSIVLFFSVFIPTYLVQSEIYYIYPFVFDVIKFIVV